MLEKIQRRATKRAGINDGLFRKLYDFLGFDGLSPSNISCVYRAELILGILHLLPKETCPKILN